MEERDEWINFRLIDWNCTKNNRFNIDTRDFSCGYYYEETPHKDIETLLKYKDRFFFSLDELKDIINKLYIESGGEKHWRFLSFKSVDKKYDNWNLKYLRIYRTDYGFIICNNIYTALNKDLFKLEINKELL